MENYFNELNKINVNDKVEEKNKLKYLSWAYAWGELKKLYPKSFYTIYENKDQLNYFHDGKTAWVKTGVTIVTDDFSQELIEMLPIMDYKNKSIPLEQITSFDVNKTIQRSLTKAIARHGIGLYIYAGEDLPEEEKEIEKEPAKATSEQINQIRALSDDEKYNQILTMCKGDINNLTQERATKIIARLNTLNTESKGVN